MKTIVLIVTLALSLVVGLALAQSVIERPREVLGSGASESAAGGVSLRATLGQPVAGAVSSAGGEVSLGQGFWGLGAEYRVYVPVVFRDDS
jgi:hypothetical protein